MNSGGFTLANTVTYNKYQYDEGGRLSGIQTPNVGFVTIGEYTWNRPASMTLPGGTRKTYAYDPLMRLKQITTIDPGGNPLLDYSYGYDKMDNIATRTTEHGAYAYDYDDLYRLTAADNPTETDEAFTYDTVGNRLTSTDTTSAWEYNQNNELGGYDDVSFEYDPNGNLIKKTVGSVVTSYVYNIENRLTEVWNGEAGTGSLIASYCYDPFGRRLWKEDSGVRTHFHYTDEGLIGEYDAAGSELRAYGYKPGSTWTTDPLFMKTAGQYYFYHNDHLGTPQKLTAVNGEVVWQAVYSSFGETTVEIETVENYLRFPGQYFDEETGLHYNWHRYYDPSIGRYLRTDPSHSIQPQGGPVPFLHPFILDNPQELNLFLYVSNNPVSWIDAWALNMVTPDGSLPGIPKHAEKHCVKCNTVALEKCLDKFVGFDPGEAPCNECLETKNRYACRLCEHDILMLTICYVTHCKIEECEKECN